MMKLLMRRKLFATFLAMVLLPAGLAPACPNCKDSIPNSDAQQASNLPRGFNASIFFMLGGFFAVTGFVVRLIVKETRNPNQG
jgi:hypothetical protein